MIKRWGSAGLINIGVTGASDRIRGLNVHRHRSKHYTNSNYFKLTVKFAEVFCWTISDVTLLKSTIMISIPRFQNEKKITDKRFWRLQ